MTQINPDAIPAYPQLLRLDGRNIVVIGAGQGMGRQTSHALAQCGATVICVDINDELARTVANEVGGIAWVGDVTQADEVDRLISETVAQIGGPLNGLVDIVGMAAWSPAIDLEEHTWDAQFDICLKHAYLLGSRVGRHLVDAGAGGSMVFIASVHGLTASVRHGAYGAAKAGLISWVKTLANELGDDGIRVNAVAPGSILTPRILAAGSAEIREQAANIAPLRRNGLPQDVASALLFLTSDLSAFITGQTLAVDGGVSIADPFERLLF
ncbi:NAD(P)-dependent dehydrogenase (short-subunit alcohol dehydrogenase family) [Leucobacter exalbidus]|uniref:NAD(P)-dependent dehydrogenase (Short-subunit alcohol dehydrogenase family) n=1 Tax=Leucobacter exalbidus TaxID=662960 RepID=A0A940T3B3_9MICO|nr:SDR family oxidoreductase [Leucobacter exalbidus]MBP1325982.1 NAD(P)-dependent dehydrogenase (short-subunit alcohol dehydrogenase family) [Leucobacter exalbidus]